MKCTPCCTALPWAGALWVIMDNLDVAIVKGNSEANGLHQHYAVFRLSMLSAVGLFDGKKIIPTRKIFTSRKFDFKSTFVFPMK